eukprot:COSAG01_NODE_4681_length_4821_cov_3.217493_4_plen_514_part_00
MCTATSARWLPVRKDIVEDCRYLRERHALGGDDADDADDANNGKTASTMTILRKIALKWNPLPGYDNRMTSAEKRLVQQDDRALKYVPLKLRNDPSFVRAAVALNGFALEHAPDWYTDDAECVKLAVKEDGHSLKYASKTQKGNVDVVAIAVDGRDDDQLMNGVDGARKTWTLSTLKQFLERKQAGVDDGTVSGDENMTRLKMVGFLRKDPRCRPHPRQIRRSAKRFMQSQQKSFSVHTDFATELSHQSCLARHIAKFVNFLEKCCQRDIDGDGDVGEIGIRSVAVSPGSPLQWASEMIRTVSFQRPPRDGVPNVGDEEVGDKERNRAREVVELAVSKNVDALNCLQQPPDNDAEALEIYKQIERYSEIHHLEQVSGIDDVNASLKKVTRSEDAIDLIVHEGADLQFASNAMRGSKNVVMAALRNTGSALRFASSTMRDDEDVVMQAVKVQGQALMYASNRLRDKDEVVREAVGQDWTALQYASHRCQGDRLVVQRAMQNDKTNKSGSHSLDK